MKIQTLIGSTLVLLSAILVVDRTPARAATESPGSAPAEFADVERALVDLLKSGDAARFVDVISASTDDWSAVRSTNATQRSEGSGEQQLQGRIAYERSRMDAAARQLLARAAELKLDFSKVRLTARSAPTGRISTIGYPDLMPEGESLPWTPRLEVSLTAEPLPDAANAGTPAGEFKIALNGLVKFPGGWKCSDSAQWIAFPPGVLDEKGQDEMVLLVKASNREPLHAADDPALPKLGEALIRFLRTRDMDLYRNEVLLNIDAVWSMIQAQAAATGRQSPPREALEEQWQKQQNELIRPAQTLVEVMDRLGVDLKDAAIEIKELSIERLESRGGPGSVEGLQGSPLRLSLSVRTDAQTKTGAPLSGEYVLAGSELLRIKGRWYVSRDLRWKQLPAGIADEETARMLQFEDHVAEHGSLPPGTEAPDIEFVRLDNGEKARLSDFRGKIVILDFWATWCGPCQEPMARMQTLHDEHPEWNEQVVIVPLSIDDRMATVRTHVEQRGWTNTFNVWAGEGGWHAPSARTYRIRGIPTCYVIDANGKIAGGGHPMSVRPEEAAGQLVKALK